MDSKEEKKPMNPLAVLMPWMEMATKLPQTAWGKEGGPIQFRNVFEALMPWIEMTAKFPGTDGNDGKSGQWLNPLEALKPWMEMAAKFSPTAGAEGKSASPFDPMEALKKWQEMASKLPQAEWGKGAQPMQPAQSFEALNSWSELNTKLSHMTLEKFSRDALEYCTDWWQRWVLFMDTMRQRGNNMLEHYENGMPPLLDYEYEVVLDARTFERPANYTLLRIKHPEGTEPAPGRRPVLVIDPRAGHGPGIGGFKKDSEVGMALLEGHPVYFCSFSPDPCPGQTLEDVERAEVRFLEEIHKRHPDRDFPIVYGNCQAGWAVAMLGADRPDVTGPVVINGAPMSYWAGAEGVNPMRLAGGLTGGAWATRFMCDLGAGLFDGVYLVQNFENLNPANTLWKKDYNLFSNVDKEAQRYLDFEKWWTGFYLMNEEEILWIVGNLFIGNKLEKGVLELGPNHKIDMRKMEDPLVVFASGGDNITPPQQALHWISEVYETTEDLKKAGQRIIYLLNPHIGHLGIFVAASIARKEHRSIIEHIEAMQNLKPGLYQMIIDGETGEKDPLKDQFVVHFEERDIKDVRYPVAKSGIRQDDQYF